MGMALDFCKGTWHAEKLRANALNAYEFSHLYDLVQSIVQRLDGLKSEPSVKKHI